METPIRGYGVRASLVRCEFWPDTANDPSTYYKDDEVYTITHAATGQWRITLRNPHMRVSVVGLALGLATPGMCGLSYQVDNEATASTAASVLVSYCSSGTTLADIAANADNRIGVLLYVEDGYAA